MNPSSVSFAWDPRCRETLVHAHGRMVKRIASHLATRLPRTIQYDDLVQSGMLGLVEAAAHYDASKGASFETYANIRIRGHMLDEVRRNDWIPRSVCRNSRIISEAVRLVENGTHREAKDHEVALQLGVSLDEYQSMLADSNGAHLHGFDDVGVTDDSLRDDDRCMSTEPHVRVQQEDGARRLQQMLGLLPKNQQLMLQLYYKHDLNLKEIGDILGVTESRVSQLHSQATHRLKMQFQSSRENL